MSETFLIKKTAFDNFGDYANRTSNSIIIGQGELNGPGGTDRTTDLKLYGYGAPNWGEGHDQNILRILENNACPAKELNDYNPATGNYDYDPGVDPLLPKGENDLGFGNGITTPMIGQNWYNTSNGLMYTYTITDEWSSAGEGATFLGDVDMALNRIMNLGAPTDDYDAINKLFADATYVKQSGSTMSGTLDMVGNRIENIAPPSTTLDAINTVYADSRYMQFNGGVMTGDVQFEIPSSPNLQESNGIKWSGNSDLARIYVEGYGGTEDSRLTFYMGDDAASGDYMSFMLKDSGITTEVLEIRSNLVTFNVDIDSTGNNITNVGTLGSLNINTTDLSVSNDVIVDNWIYLTNAVDSRITSSDGTIIQFDNNGTVRDINFYIKNTVAMSIEGDLSSGPQQLSIHTDVIGNNKRISNFAWPSFNGDLTSKLYVDSAISSRLAFGTGSVANGGFIPLPSGFNYTQCQIVVGAGYWIDFGGSSLLYSFNCQHGPATGQVTAEVSSQAGVFGGTGNYMIVCRQ